MIYKLRRVELLVAAFNFLYVLRGVHLVFLWFIYKSLKTSEQNVYFDSRSSFFLLAAFQLVTFSITSIHILYICKFSLKLNRVAGYHKLLLPQVVGYPLIGIWITPLGVITMYL